MKKLYLILITAIPLISFGQDNLQNQQHIQHNMMIRLVEIEIEPEYLDEYLNILKEESNASMKIEPGVISIYPMNQKDKPNEIRLLEIYANQKAYESHLETPHFKYYKTTTLKMVKSLKLVDMNAIDPDAMPMIFKKIR
ncbi:putative quinol monooxygenase [Jiulongibacter sediminis]|jgi:quinol monooxygenase YgiN|uniref:putative quinol monooxygenase n=1 Tax=Jiulongibacter sediminis TaxID=1605367 RepID=UPI0026EBF833|nr:putative quinol monooxygenase [Jiulongibacter sediminis]